MSNLIKCNCENCGGLLEVKNDAEQIVCKYCGTAFLLREQIIINNINIKPQALLDGSTKAKRENEKINYSSSYIGVEKIKAKKEIFRITDGTLIKYLGQNSEVTIPDSVKYIGENAFYGTPIKRVIIPSSVQAIGKRAFANCTELEYIEINTEIEKIEDETFFNCFSLLEISLPSLCETIGIRAFANCKLLRYVKATNKELMRLTNIGTEAFSNCTSLKEIDQLAFYKKGNGCTIYRDLKIGKKAFYKCKELTLDKEWFNNPSFSFNQIEEYTFCGCNNIKEIIFPPHITIGKCSFAECANLSSITLDYNTKIQTEAFANCSNLNTIIISGNVDESTINADINAFMNTPAFVNLINRAEANLCLLCGSTTKKGYFGYYSKRPRKCNNCGKEQNYRNHFYTKNRSQIH